METVLVTGGAGFIGSHLVHALLVRGYDVRVYDNLSSGRRDNLADIVEDVEVIEADICDADELSRAFRGVDYCLHQAAIPSVPRSITSPRHTNRTNVEGSLNVFMAAKVAGTRRVVYASSSAVYGNVSDVPVNESHSPSPLSPYGVSKTAAEMYAQSLGNLHHIDFVGLRYFNVFGPRQDPKSPYAGVISKFIERISEKKPLMIFGDGKQSRDFIYVKDIAQVNRAALEGEGTGACNVATGQTRTLLQVIDALSACAKQPLRVEHQAPRDGDIQHSAAYNERLKELLGYTPKTSLDEGLTALLNSLTSSQV